jgi:glycerol-3-phosphate acyltransferase PlsY
MAIAFSLLLVGAYLVGSIPTAYLAARWGRGIDIRRYGSGNVGASNVVRSSGKWLAAVVSIVDLAKGGLMVWAAQAAGLPTVPQVAIGLAAIIGHNWPVFLRFSGGRGVLTTMGVALALPLLNGPLVPWAFIVSLALAAVFIFGPRNLPLGTIIGMAALPLVSWLTNEPLAFILGFLAMFLVMVTRRLTAPKTSLTASVSTGELLINRLLLDRDIRDREAWIYRQPAQGQKKGKGDPE